MPAVIGRADCHVQNVYFDNCHFAHQHFEDMHTKFADRYHLLGRELTPPTFRYVDHLIMNNTSFSVE